MDQFRSACIWNTREGRKENWKGTVIKLVLKIFYRAEGHKYLDWTDPPSAQHSE